MAPATGDSIGTDIPLVEADQPAVELASPAENAQPSALHTDGHVAPEVPNHAEVRSGALAAVTNADFVAAIFGPLPAGISPAVCTKYGDPTIGGWPAMKAGNVDLQCSPNWNNYVNCSSFHEDEYGNVQARKDKFHALHFILLDDMGTKVQWAQLGDFKPSFVIETSPGNYQAGIILAEPLTDISLATQLVGAFIAKGLSDPGATGAARWARFPSGVNGKPKYKSEFGEPFQCRLDCLNPEWRYTVDEIVAGLELVMAPVPAHAASLSGVDSALPAREIDPAAVARLPQLLDAIDPDCERPEWVRVLMAVFHTTGGSDDGLAMVDAWSSRGKKYRGIRDIEAQWHSFRADIAKPVTIGTLVKMARDAGADVVGLMQGCEHFEDCDTVVVEAEVSKAGADKGINPLAKFSLLGQTQKLETQMVEEKAILGQLVLQGQATVIFAPPNMGKTAITIHLIREAIDAGLLNPALLFYINMDDNSSGLVAKNKLADEYAFNMVADGHQGFELADFNAAMEEMIACSTAKGVVIVLDTLKKFVNPMAKDQCRQFTKMARKFSMMGGTVIALAHVNKNRNTSGKVVYAGTSDIIDDFDCAYTMDVVSERTEANTKVVEFSNSKRRGGVALSAAYSYSVEQGLLYEDLILSIQEVDADQLKPLKQVSEALSDAAMIAAIEGCISAGVVTKMKLAEAAANHVKASNRLALKVIKKYTGEDPTEHRWKFVVRARGAQVYELLQCPAAPLSEMVQPAPAAPMPEQADALPDFNDATGSTETSCAQGEHADILDEAIALFGGGYTDSECDPSEMY